MATKRAAKANPPVPRRQGEPEMTVQRIIISRAPSAFDRGFDSGQNSIGKGGMRK